MTEFISSVVLALRTIANTFSWRDVLDILLATYLFYTLINLLVNTRTGLLIKGIMFLFAAYFIANWLQL